MKTAELILKFIDTLIWPGIFVFILISFHESIQSILANFKLKKANLPGGISFEAFPEHIENAKILSDEVRKENPQKEKKEKAVSIPLSQANTRQVELGLTPSPYQLQIEEYGPLAEENPQLALAGIRLETEIILKNLAKGFKVPLEQNDNRPLAIANKLYQANAITLQQLNLVKSILELCNAAIHGQDVLPSQAQDIIGVATALRDEYVAWLGWGFPDKAKPNSE